MVFLLGEKAPEFGLYEFPNRSSTQLPVQRLLLQMQAWHKRIDAEDVSRSQIALEEGVSKARVTQILGLAQLAPEVQQAILDADPIIVGERGITERNLRPLLHLPHSVQLEAVEEMMQKARQGANLRIQRLYRETT